MQNISEFHLREIKKLFHKRFYYKEICQIMKNKYDFDITLPTIKRLFKQLNLKRYNANESPFEEIVLAIIIELQDSGANLGYVAMWKRLIKEYHLTVKQKTVLKILRVIDPEGVEARKRKRLKRRVYINPGPNQIWHADGNLKNLYCYNFC